MQEVRDLMKETLSNRCLTNFVIARLLVDIVSKKIIVTINITKVLGFWEFL